MKRNSKSPAGHSSNTIVSRRLSTEQEEARLTMYEEAAQHLEMSVCDDDYEREAAKIIAKQIRALAVKFERSRNGHQCKGLPQVGK